MIIQIPYSYGNQPTEVLQLSHGRYNLAGYINFQNSGVRSLVDGNFYNYQNSAFSKGISLSNDGKPLFLVYARVSVRDTKIIGLHNLGKAQCVNTNTIFNSRFFLFQ